MMNDETEQFEKRVRQQPVKQIPAEWRAEILSAARATSAPPHAARRLPESWLSTLNSRLSALLWPHPKAWAGLAATWILIFVLNLSTRENSTLAVAEKVSPPSPEVIVQLKKQQRMFAELVGTYEAPDVDRRKIFSPKPRSERSEILVG